jgi:TonB family protein
MRLVILGIAATTLATGAAQAQGSWQPQASPSPQPPIYTAVPPPPAPPRSPKEQSARPKGNPASWVRDDDYPAESRRNDEQGTTGFRLTIGADGMVTGCDITMSSGFARLDEAACRVMTERGRFNPALDNKGKPTTGSWASRFRWVLPKPDLMPVPQPFLDTISFVIEADGTASNCSHTGPGPLSKAASPCGNGLVFEPPRDAAGNPVRRKVTAVVSLQVSDPDAVPLIAPLPPAAKPKRRKP